MGRLHVFASLPATKKALRHVSHTQAVEQACSVSSAAQLLQMRIFEAVVAEFAPATASAMQMPWEFHSKCRASFQARAAAITAMHRCK